MTLNEYLTYNGNENIGEMFIDLYRDLEIINKNDLVIMNMDMDHIYLDEDSNSFAFDDEFKMGDEITVVFGTDIEDNGYRIIFKKNAGDQGFDLLEEAYDAKMDGKTCNEVKVKLSSEKGVEPTLTGIIRVAPYNKQNKGDNSELFIVKE